MRVLVDARKVDDGGIGTYIRNLVCGLLEHRDVEVGAICASASVHPPEWAGRVTLHHDDTRCYSFSEFLLFPKRDLLAQYDLFHVPHYTLPVGLPIPTVITVHDLIHVTHPPSWYHPLVAARLIRSSVRRATRVLTVSGATERALVEFMGGGRSVSEKIRVVPNAIAPISGGRTDVVLAHSPYLLSVCSTAKPHKGMRELLEAFGILKSQRRARAGNTANYQGLKLKVVGRGANPERLRSFDDIANDDVEFLGEVSSDELDRLYAGATALVVPSRAEGFCLPVIEAQARSIRVVSTPIPAVEELMTPQDTLADDFSPGALAHAMQRALGEPVSSEAAVAQEYARHLARFDRKKLAAEVISVYQEALVTTAGVGE